MQLTAFCDLVGMYPWMQKQILLHMEDPLDRISINWTGLD